MRYYYPVLDNVWYAYDAQVSMSKTGIMESCQR